MKRLPVTSQHYVWLKCACNIENLSIKVIQIDSALNYTMSSLLATIFPDRDFNGARTFVAATLVLGITLRFLYFLTSLLQKKFREDQLLKDIPGPPKHWFWGNIKDIKSAEERLPVTMHWMIKYGGTVKTSLGPFINQVILSESEDVKAILSTTEPKELFVYSFVEPWIGDGLILSKGRKWARNRRLLTPAFHFDILKHYVSIFNTSTHVIIEKWKRSLKEGPKIEMFHHISLMTLDSILKCAFNYDRPVQTEGRTNPYIESVYKLAELATKRQLNFFHQSDLLYYFSYQGYNFRKACQTVHNFSRNVINARRLEKRSNLVLKKKHIDFLDILLEAKDDSGGGLTDTEIQHEVDTFMFAGHDTTASGLSWLLYNMAAHPEHQEKCYQEIMSVLGNRNNVMWEDLPRFEYLTMCIKESLRTHTTVPFVSRRTTKPLKLKNGVMVPEDIWVRVAIYTVHHNPKVWKDPETFNPLRFKPENSKGRSPHAFVPFSAGPRNCIGQNFAMNELKTCSALMLKYFEFSVAVEPIKCPEIVLRAKDGLWLNVRERRHWEE